MGLSMTTATAITGLLTGAMPANEAMCMVFEYSMGGRIDLLRGAGLAAGGVSIELRRLAGAVEHDAFHHLAHLRCGHGGDHAMRAGRQRIGQLLAGA